MAYHGGFSHAPSFQAGFARTGWLLLQIAQAARQGVLLQRKKPAFDTLLDWLPVA